MTRLSLLILGGLLAAAPVASAAPPGANAGSAAASAAAPASSLGEGADDDDSATTAKDERPTDQNLRRSYLRRIKKELNKAVHANGKAMTDAERTAIKAHWHVTMRLWRIRFFADTDNNPAAVTQVDALIAKQDAKTLAALAPLNAKAPALGAAPAGSK
jgi:hypothetical protein